MSHPILECAAVAGAALKDVVDVNPVFMAPGEKAEALRALAALEARVAELRLRVLATAEDLAEQTGARDAAAWLAATLPVDGRAAHADLRLAGELGRHEPVRAALGDISLDQARAITRVLEDLPGELEVSVVQDAEAELVRLAATHAPAELRRLGAHLLTVVAPEVADELEARRLADLERCAHERTRLSITPVGDGTTRISGLVPDAVGTRLRTVLESFAQPRVAALEADGRVLPRSRLMGHALGQLLETLDPKRLPAHGGDATALMVTIGLDQLRADLGSGLIGGTGLSAGEIRRLACTAKVIPAVLDGKGRVLDLGKAKRLYNAAQRKALRVQHPVCQGEGCTVPAIWCDAHHDQAWKDGGPTDLANGALLCGHHHHRAHDDAYDTSRLPNGDYRFHRRT